MTTGRALEHVLYVDDEADLREIARLSLEVMGGLTVDVAASGAEALELIRRRRPDLVILDVMMPDMDGPATLAALCEAFGEHRVPMVFLTARSEAAEVARLRALGAVDVIAKPFDPMALPDRLRAVWSRYDG